MTDTPTSPKSPIWLRITLFLSLALNLLIAGLVGGFFLFSGPNERADRGPRDLGSLYTRALDQEDRRALRCDFARGLASQGRERGAIVMDVQAALKVLRATPFDVDAFGQALANQAAAVRNEKKSGDRPCPIGLLKCPTRNVRLMRTVWKTDWLVWQSALVNSGP